MPSELPDGWVYNCLGCFDFFETRKALDDHQCGNEHPSISLEEIKKRRFPVLDRSGSH